MWLLAVSIIEMANINDYNFPDEEEEDDFNPQAAVGSDDEDDEKPHVNGEDDDASPVRNGRARGSSRDRKDELKDEDEDDSGVIDAEKDGNNEAEDGEDRQQDGEEDDDDDEDDDMPRRRRTAREDEEDDDEDEEEDDEDDDDDIEGQPSRKRRRRGPRNQFLDVEAEVDEEDEEVDEEEDELPGDEMHPDDLQELPPGADRDDRKHRELDRQREREYQLDAEDQAARFKERYGRQQRGTTSTGAIVPQRLLLPSANDPRIWTYMCKPGKEREIVMRINEKISQRANSRDPIQIMSAFERGEPMPGRIYIEARLQEHIAAAIDGVSHIWLSKGVKMVEIEEMPDLFRIKKSKQLEPGMYVRIRRGLYAGDLAQIDEVEQNGTDVTVRIVPRLDYGANEDTNAAPAELDANGKRKRPIKVAGQRPPQRLFSEAEAKKRHGRYLQKTSGLSNAWNFAGKEYQEGFLIETLRVNAVQTENVNPTLEEVSKFASETEDGTENLDLAALAATLKQSTATSYLPGDKVELFRGEQKGVEGRAVEVYGDVVKMRVESAGALRNQTIEAPIKDLRKLFRDGDHVKVIGGSKYFDEVGMVVRVKDDRVTLLTDSNQTEITVFSKDLREATDSGGNVASSKFSLFDLVQLDASTVGVVIKVDRESLRVLDQTGSVRTLLPSAISNKLERRKGAVATDHDGNEMKIDDQIKEFGGEQKTGRVLHIHRNFIFAQNRERADNAGVFVARQANVITVAAKGGRSTGNGIDLTKMNPAVKQNGAPGMPGAGMLPPQQKGRDRLIGKTVKIRTGPNKGKIGIVKDSGDTTAKVELHAQNKIVSIPKEQLTQIEAHTGKPMGPPGMGQSMGGGIPGRTPAPGYGRTPFGAGAAAGGRTPAYAMGASGGRTPAWKQDAGARTPAYGGGATAYGGQTAYGGFGGGTSYGGGSVWGGNVRLFIQSFL